jgi:hypothetical protein
VIHTLIYLAKIEIYLDIPFYGVYDKFDTDNTFLNLLFPPPNMKIPL